MYLMTGEPLKQPSQRNQWTESSDLPAKLALPPHPASSFIKKGSVKFEQLIVAGLQYTHDN